MHRRWVSWFLSLHNRPSMTMSLSQSQGGTTCKPQINWVPFLFPHHIIWRVRSCTNRSLSQLLCSRDDELDKKGNPTLHFQRDVSRKFYNTTIRNLFDTMQTLMCLAGFDPYVAMLILLSSVVVMDTCMVMGSTSGWSDRLVWATAKYRSGGARKVQLKVLF
jgi:hypothetical protein